MPVITVTIPESVTQIGNYAFFGCSSLSSVTIPESVTQIGAYAFDGCSSLSFDGDPGVTYARRRRCLPWVLIECWRYKCTVC